MHNALPEAGIRNRAPKEIEVVVLDFDGTIMVYDGSPGHFHPEVIRLLNDLQDRGIFWVANSGRDLEDQKLVLERSRERGLLHEPDAVIASESLVYLRDGREFIPLEAWNALALKGLRTLHKVVQEELEPYRKHIEEIYTPHLILWEEYATAFLVDNREEKPRELFHDLMDWLKEIPTAMLSMNGGWVAVMLRGLGKGNALRAWAEVCDLSPRSLLAIGDHFNDLTMLGGRVAHYVGCPGDAIPEVRQTVARHGGWVAEQPGPLGTVEVIRRALNLG
ncbi:MAG TPA: HAD hydrolase family protein [Kiritimatiellia bacterium]|nr:HAD hydrolase family protein [Kiritimatiellia bacterium]